MAVQVIASSYTDGRLVADKPPAVADKRPAPVFDDDEDEILLLMVA